MEMLILIRKKCAKTAMTIHGNKCFKDKRAINYMKNDLLGALYLSPNALFSGRMFSPLLDILKASFQQFQEWQ
jgi:hypothetical protein